MNTYDSSRIRVLEGLEAVRGETVFLRGFVDGIHTLVVREEALEDLLEFETA